MSWHSIAALTPAAPAPMTATSWSVSAGTGPDYDHDPDQSANPKRQSSASRVRSLQPGDAPESAKGHSGSDRVSGSEVQAALGLRLAPPSTGPTVPLAGGRPGGRGTSDREVALFD